MRSRIRRGAFSLFAGTGLGQLVAGIAALATASQFGAQAVGVLGVATALAAPGAMLLGGRYDLGLPSYRDESVASSILGFLRSVSVIYLAVALAWAVLALNVGDLENGRELVALAPLCMAATLAFDTELFQSLRKKSLRINGVARSIVGLVQAAVLLVGAVVGPSAVVATMSLVLGKLCGTLLLRWKSTRSRSDTSYRAALAHEKAFPKMAVPTGLITNLSISLPIYAISALFSLEAAGVYFLARRAIGMPLQLLSQAVSQASYSEMSQKSPEAVVEIVKSSEKTLAYVSVGCCVVGAIGSILPYGQLIGSEWGALSGLMFPVTLMAAVQLYAAPYRHTLLTIGRLGVQLRIQITRLLIIFIALVVAWVSSFDLIETVWILTLSTVISYWYYRVAVMREITFMIRNRAA